MSKTILITGAGSGFGEGTAFGLARLGHNVIATAEKKAREEATRLGVKGTYWVQLAGGSNQDRMATEYRRLSAKAGKLLKSRTGYVTEGKDYFRLVIGPFDSKSDSQAFVNKLAKEGVDGFSWTRTPAQIKIEKLSSR